MGDQTSIPPKQRGSQPTNRKCHQTLQFQQRKMTKIYQNILTIPFFTACFFTVESVKMPIEPFSQSGSVDPHHPPPPAERNKTSHVWRNQNMFTDDISTLSYNAPHLAHLVFCLVFAWSNHHFGGMYPHLGPLAFGYTVSYCFRCRSWSSLDPSLVGYSQFCWLFLSKPKNRPLVCDTVYTAVYCFCVSQLHTIKCSF